MTTSGLRGGDGGGSGAAAGAAAEPDADGGEGSTGAPADEAVADALSTFHVDRVQTTRMVAEKLDADDARARSLLEALCERDRLTMARSGTGHPVWLRR
jgi:hypothetical protein